MEPQTRHLQLVSVSCESKQEALFQLVHHRYFAWVGDTACDVLTESGQCLKLHELPNQSLRMTFRTTPPSKGWDDLYFIYSPYRYFDRNRVPPVGVHKGGGIWHYPQAPYYEGLTHLLRYNDYAVVRKAWARHYVEYEHKMGELRGWVEYANYAPLVLDAIQLSALGDGRMTEWLAPRILRVGPLSPTHKIRAPLIEWRGVGITLTRITHEVGCVLTRYEGKVGHVYV